MSGGVPKFIFIKARETCKIVQIAKRLKLMSHTIKLWKGVTETRLRQKTYYKEKVLENKYESDLFAMKIYREISKK